MSSVLEKSGKEESAYETVVGDCKFNQYVFRQLVHFLPAPTIRPIRTKVGNRLAPGAFMGYYLPPGGRFSGK